MSDKTYNGWSNYETWNVSLWIDNEYEIYRSKCRLISLMGEDLSPGQVEELVREWFPKGTPDFDSVDDYDKVDWQEIADSWKEE